MLSFNGIFRLVMSIENVSILLFHFILSNIYKNEVYLYQGTFVLEFSVEGRKNIRIICLVFFFLQRPIQRAPRALTADIIRVPFIQDTINLIRRSHQIYFDFSAFIDGRNRSSLLNFHCSSIILFI